MRGLWRTALAAASVFALALAGGLTAGLPATPARADSASGKGYMPGLGDLMNASMQVHHTKLWLAGRSGNWPLAAYELKELRETVDDVQAFASDWQGVPVGAMVNSLKPGFGSLNDAIAAKNPAAFDSAFHQLTAACTACHAGANRAEIRIIVPSPRESGKFIDQDFTPSGDGQ